MSFFSLTYLQSQKFQAPYVLEDSNNMPETT